MTFFIIGIVVAVIAAVLCGVWLPKKDWCSDDGAILGAVTSGSIAIILIALVIIFGIDAKTNKALMQSHLDNPTNYTYSQLAEHNEKVAKSRAWQGTIFSFYNDTDLQVIDIDNVSQKVIIDSKEK